MGAYSLLEKRFGQLPGTGELITNVSIGDLTDQSMADAGDPYVQANGPTTIVQNGQRYLDLPSMPLIPTYVADPSGQLDPLGSTEGQDPSLDEVMLDFSVMAPLPHNLQRPSATYQSGYQIIGIDPGLHRLLVLHWVNWGPYGQACSTADSPSLQTYDTLTLKMVSDVSTGCQYTVYGGRVDTIRHRAAILAHRASDGADIVLPLSLATGSAGTPIDVDDSSAVPAGWYHGIALNQATGVVYLSHTGGPVHHIRRPERPHLSEPGLGGTDLGGGRSLRGRTRRRCGRQPGV